MAMVENNNHDVDIREEMRQPKLVNLMLLREGKRKNGKQWKY